MNARRLENRVAIVTGAGQGVGEGIARRLAQEGATVVVAARRAETGEPVVESIRSAGGQAVCIVTDVSVSESVDACVASTVQQFGRLDIMVHNAFMGGIPHKLEKAQIENLRVVHSLVAAQLFVEPEPTSAQFEGWNSLGTNEIPLVWTHMSGHKSLVLGSTAEYIVGMNPIESRRLLVKLRDWATQERFTYRHKWSMGDCVMWDNTGTLHRALPYDPASGRLLTRTKLAGEESFA